MIISVERQNLQQIKNRSLAAYARQYVEIYEDFIQRVKQAGLEFSQQDERPAARERIEALGQQGVQVRNDDKSLFINRISPACEACRTGIGCATFYISLQCHRSCYYCFNPNQDGYTGALQRQRDVTGELQEIQARKLKIRHLALTGGEPLLHKDEAVKFFDYAKRKFPQTYKRLYTSGDHLNPQILSELKDAGLEEIRLSIRMHDLEKGQRHTFDRLALAREYIPVVMVEMPVLPGTLEAMKEVLLELDRLEIFGINLLEFCFPLQNAEEYRRRGFLLKYPPYRILYDYWYAGGLPVAGSELVCLDLLSFAIEQNLKIGVHYCSLENKHTGQLYQQNARQPLASTAYFSEKDYLIKTAKVFGTDQEKVLRAFRRMGFSQYTINRRFNYLEFPVGLIPALKNLSVEICISSSVFEYRDGERYLRELKLDLTTPQQFDLTHDL